MSASATAETARKVARSVLERNLGVRRGENVTIETWSGTPEWANAFVLEAWRLQARPMVLYVDEGTYWTAVKEFPATRLGRVGSHEWAALRQTDAYIYLYGPGDVARESKLPGEQEAALTAYDSEWFRIIEKAKVRCVRIDVGRANTEEARRLGWTVDDWRKEIVDAILVDPRELKKDGQTVARALQNGKSIRVTHPNGTALELRLRGRRPRLHDGQVDAADLQQGEPFEPLPSGWVAVALDERFAEGEIVANVPSAHGASTDEMGPAGPVSGGRWKFRDGKLQSFEYDEGGEAFAKAYKALGNTAIRPGSLNIGLNPRIERLPLMEDQRRGRFTLSVGRNAFLDGATMTPHFHAYLVLEGADVQVDGRWLIRAGELV